ncbi:MAG: phage tail tube protein [Methanomassiliicoccales archaeon]|jgi:hypothetical protein
MGNVFPGYRGWANIEGVGPVRFGDASITAKQEIVAPDMIMGDWDHDAYYYGPIEVGGSISGPVTETFAKANGLWDWGVKRVGCGVLSTGTITLYYYCGSTGNRARAFTGMTCNSLNFSCTAGDVANFSIDVLGASAGPWLTSDPILFSSPEKLITWDKVFVRASGGGPGGSALTTVNYSNFDFTISNNLETVYSLSQSDLFPFEIVPGLRTITGTLSVYNIPQADGVTNWSNYAAGTTSQIEFSIGGLSITMKVQFHRIEPASSVGPIISTLGFTGVTHQTGTGWV